MWIAIVIFFVIAAGIILGQIWPKTMGAIFSSIFRIIGFFVVSAVVLGCVVMIIYYAMRPKKGDEIIGIIIFGGVGLLCIGAVVERYINPRQ